MNQTPEQPIYVKATCTCDLTIRKINMYGEPMWILGSPVQILKTGTCDKECAKLANNLRNLELS